LISNPLQTPYATSGTWNIGANFFNTYDRGLLVFGSYDPYDSLPINYVGYLILAANGTSGTWTSPFDDEDYYWGHYGAKVKVAYIKLFGHLKAPPGPGPSPVPLPAPFLLFAAAVGGLGAMRWWKARSKSAA
jgi:hypothetical protein